MKKLLQLFIFFIFTNTHGNSNLVYKVDLKSVGKGEKFINNPNGCKEFFALSLRNISPNDFILANNREPINSRLCNGGDHALGLSKMLVIDNSKLAINHFSWMKAKNKNGIFRLLPASKYISNNWIKILKVANLANINIQFFNNTEQFISHSRMLSMNAIGWQKQSYSLVPSKKFSCIELWNNNFSVYRNDFGRYKYDAELMQILPSAIVSVSNPTVCENNSIAPINSTISFTGSGGIAPYTFAYNINGGVTQYIISAGATSVATLIVPNNIAGSYMYSLIGVSTALSLDVVTGQSVNTIVSPKPIVSVNSPLLTLGQNAAQITAIISAAGTYSYSWTLPIGFINPGNVATFLATYAGAGPYPYTGNFSVLVTNTITGCTGNAAGTFGIANTTCPVVSTIVNAPICNSGNCANITAKFLDVKKTTSYNVTSIPFAPVPIVAPSGNQMCNFNQDDSFSSVTPIGFNFCFYGNTFSDFQVSSNMFLTFNSKSDCTPYKSNWAITGNFPSTTMSRDYFNSIFFAMQDTDPRFGGVDQIFHSPNTVDIRYRLDGVAPCRKMIIMAKDMGLFNCDQSQGSQESQVILYENSNIVEVHITKRSACTRWNPGDVNLPNALTGGYAVVGLQNADGTQATIPPGRNSLDTMFITPVPTSGPFVKTWETVNESWRFTPNGASDVTILWKDAGVIVGNTPSIAVCPTATTTYTAEVTYDNCAHPYTATATQTVTVNADLTNNPINISQTTNIFNLNVNTTTVLGGLTPANYTISYHNTYNNALTAISPISPSNMFASSGQTIYMYIKNNITGCVVVKSFNLFVTNCLTIYNPITISSTTIQNVCLGGDPSIFNTNTTFTGSNSISYVYFNSQQTTGNMYGGGTLLASVTPAVGNANYDAPILGTVGSLPNLLGTYWVYAIANPTPIDPTCRPYQEIKVVVAPLNSITLTSALITANQSACTGMPISTITYNTIGALGATFSGLPSGITGSWSANVVTISGATTVLGLANYTITLTGGCGTITQTGTINVNTINTVALSSGAGSNTQSVCLNNAITNITYNTNGATGVTPVGLPSGVIANLVGNVLTILGSPTVVGTYNFTIALTGGCGTVTTSGTIIVNDFTLTSSSRNYTACLGSPLNNITYSANAPMPPSSITFSPVMPGITGFVIGNTFEIAGTPTVVGIFNYTISTASVCGNIITTGTITVPVNSNTATITANPITICPGYKSTITVTGTPNTIVTITPSGGAQFVVNISSNGIGIFSTPNLSKDTTYYLNTIVSNTTGCSKTLTGSLTISVIQGGCATVTTQEAGSIGTSALDPICSIGGCVTLSANISNLTPGTTPIKETTAYTVSSIPYCPQAPFLNTGAGWVELYPGQINTDDKFATNAFPFPSASATTPAFKFSFFGIEYGKAVVGSNGVLSFNAGAPAALNYQSSGCDWKMSGTPIPSPNFPNIPPEYHTITNSIFGVFQDIDISITPPLGITKSINYGMYGTYPCRKFVMNTTNVPLYLCGNTLPGQTYQIVLYEISNIIEVYVKNRDACAHNSYRGVIGIQNASGLNGLSAPGRNANSPKWNTTNEAWRFTPSGPLVPVTFNWYKSIIAQSPAEMLANMQPASATVIGTNPTSVTDCPIQNTFYYAKASYTISGVTKTIINQNSILVYPDHTSSAVDLRVCSSTASFDLTKNTAVVAAGYLGDYDVYYFTNSVDQTAGTNALTTAQAINYNGYNGQTIYVLVEHNASTPSCKYYKQFKLYRDYIISPSASQCVALGGTPTAMTASNSFINTNGISFVYFTTQQTGNNMYSGGTPLQTVTTNSSGIATYNSGVLGTANSLPNTAGIYYVYAIASTPPTDINCRPYQEIIINVSGLTYSLTSAAGTNSQSVCTTINIIPITYLAPSATGAVFSGLPTGITGTFNAVTGVISITGTSTALGLSSYTISLVGVCGNLTISGSITIININTITLSSASSTTSQTICLNNALTNIRYATTGATGASFAGLPTGVTGSWLANVVTISGTPTVAGSYNYTVTLTGGCGSVNAIGTITVTPDNTITLSSASSTNNQTICLNNALTNIRYTTTGAAGASFAGLPTGVTGSWLANVVTISGTPTVVGSYNYNVTLTGGCGSVNATGTITVTPDNTITLSSASSTNNQTICLNNALTNIRYTTTGATGASFAGLPTGVTGSWLANVVTISGTPTVAGSYNYTVTLTGGCGSVNATGTITVTPDNTITLSSASSTNNQSICLNNALTNIRYTTTGATGASFAGLPTGVTGSWLANVVTISGTPTVAGSYNYNVTLTGGCGSVNATGNMTVTPDNTITLSSASSTNNQTICLNNALTNIRYTTTGAAGASFAGLPTGVTGSWLANVVTISGTPSVGGSYNYTVTLTGGCGSVNVTGNMTVTPDNTITLSSASSTTSQTICLNNALTNIRYTTTGATGASFAGLPTGVTGSWLANVVTISGTPTVAGSYNYTVTLTGGCGSVNATGTITVTSNPTILLSSAIGSDSQSSCKNTNITTITYSTTGITSVSFSGLPSGVSGSFNVLTNIVSIYGSSPIAGIYNFVISLTGSCGIITQNGTIGIINAPNIVNPTPLIVCDDSFYPDYNNDGYAVFDLHSKDNEITGSQPYVVQYYETQNSTTPILTNPYPNRNGYPNSQLIYVKVTNPLAPTCPNYTTLQLIVNSNPVPNKTIPDYILCDYTVNIGTSITEIFNLHNMDAPAGMTVGVTAYYYDSQANAQAGLFGTGSGILPYTYTNTNIREQIWVRLQNNTTGCFAITSFYIEVKALPSVARPIPAITLCDYNNTGDGYELFDLTNPFLLSNILAGQVGVKVSFHFTRADAVNNISLPAPLSAYQNAIPGVQTIFVKLTNVLTGCQSIISTMDLRVNQLPNPTTPLIPFNICDTDQDGFSFVNLNSYSNAISNNMTITYYATQADANSGLTINQLPTPYNAGPFTDFVYVRVEDPFTKCFKTIIISLVITQAPLAPTTGLLPDLNACDDHDNNNQDGITNFNLTTNGVLLLSSQPLAASNYTITYHTTLADAQSSNGTAPIINPLNYFSVPPNPQSIWIRIKHNTTGCFNFGTFKLNVDKPLLLTTHPVFSICDDDTVVSPFPSNIFDLSTQKSLILTGAPLPLASYNLTFYPTFPVTNSSVAIPNPLTYRNVANPQTLGVMVTTTGGCKSYTSLTISVIPKPQPRALVLPLMTLVECDKVNSPINTELFDLTTNEAYIRNGDLSLIFEYYPTTGDAIGETNIFTTPTAQELGTTTICIKIMNNQLNWQGKRCYELITQPLIVNPLPAISNQLFSKCVPAAVAPAVTIFTGRTFDLTSMNSSVLDPTITIGSTTTAQVLANYTFSYFLPGSSLAILSPSTFTNTINPQFINVKVVNKTTGCVNYATIKLIVELEAYSVTNPLQPLTNCDTDLINDGVFEFNLRTLLEPQILGTTPNPNFSVEYFYRQPLTVINQITISPYKNINPDNDLIWVVVTNNATITPCKYITSVAVKVERLAEPKITTGNDTLCYDPLTNLPISNVILDSGLSVTDAVNYTFYWYLNTSPTAYAVVNGMPKVTVTSDGIYTVKVISKSPYIGCISLLSPPFTVKKSYKPVLLNPPYFITEGFSSNQIVTVNLVYYDSSYLYSLDGGTDQSSPVFENVPIAVGSTTHTIDIKSNCNNATITGVQTIDYPHFFTPNGDGINDTWNVKGLINQPLSKIYIYDRTGKLLKQISSTSDGWDGTYNGLQMPADDYWFTVDFVEQAASRQFKAHFSLKR